MNAALLHTFGAPPRFEQFADPVPREDEAVVQVRAASLKPVDKQLANGTHFASRHDLPVVCGVDGVGVLEDGTRVFFGGPRAPYGAMAERTVVSRRFCFAIPDEVDDVTAAALPNPGVSAWLSLTWRANLSRGESVLVLGATGTTGRLAVQIAKILGAGRIVAAGRNPATLSTLPADVTIRLDQPRDALIAAFAQHGGYDVIIDYLWDGPTEALLAALTRKEFALAASEIRLIQVGESAGPQIALPAAALRSTPLTIRGTAGIPPPQMLSEAFGFVMRLAASGDLRIETERVALGAVEEAWQRNLHGCRIVLIP
jgi:NADPH:quinone reductase-like Zn-dependent oxidoreductase